MDPLTTELTLMASKLPPEARPLILMAVNGEGFTLVTGALLHGRMMETAVQRTLEDAFRGLIQGIAQDMLKGENSSAAELT